jgi:hypothetical protein
MMASVTRDTWPVGGVLPDRRLTLALKHAADPCRFSGSLAFRSAFSALPMARISSRQRALTGLGTGQLAFQAG